MRLFSHHHLLLDVLFSAGNGCPCIGISHIRGQSVASRKISLVASLVPNISTIRFRCASQNGFSSLSPMSQWQYSLNHRQEEAEGEMVSTRIFATPFDCIGSDGASTNWIGDSSFHLQESMVALPVSRCNLRPSTTKPFHWPYPAINNRTAHTLPTFSILIKSFCSKSKSYSHQ